MIALNKEEIFDIIRLKLKEWYPEFKDTLDPDIKLSLNMKTADYNPTRNRLEFKQHIVSFEYENDIVRKLTVKEIQKMVREELMCLEARVKLYLDVLDRYKDYQEEAIFEIIVDYGKDTQLVESHLDGLIDMALSIGDRGWFNELSYKKNIIKIHSSN